MSATTPTEPKPQVDSPKPHEVARWIGLYILLCVCCGLLLGVFWYNVVDLPGYYVLPDGRGTMDERGLARIFDTDAWFVALGLAVAPVLGWIAWRWLRPLGWRVVLLAAAGAELAALSAWAAATLVAPSPLRDRLANAKPGESVTVDFVLNAPSALAVWPFAALLPVLLLSSLLPDPDEMGRRSPRRRVPGSARDRYCPRRTRRGGQLVQNGGGAATGEALSDTSTGEPEWDGRSS